MNWAHNCECASETYLIQVCLFCTSGSTQIPRVHLCGMRPKPLDQDPRLHKVNYKINGIRLGTTQLPFFHKNDYLQQMTLREAQVLTLRVLKQVMEEKLDQHNVQLAQVKCLFHVCAHIYNRLAGNKGERF